MLSDHNMIDAGIICLPTSIGILGTWGKSSYRLKTAAISTFFILGGSRKSTMHAQNSRSLGSGRPRSFGFYAAER